MGDNSCTQGRRRWLTYQAIGSSAYSLDAASRRLIAGKAPLWRVINWSLTAQQTAEFRVTSGFDFYLAGILGSSAQAAGFQANIYDSTRHRVILDVPAGYLNMSGTAQHPFIRHRVYDIPPNTALLARIQNLAKAANSGQLVLFGFGDPNPHFGNAS